MKLKLLLLGRKAMTNLNSILKNRDITLPTKVCIVKAMLFPVVMYRCESWTIKKAECQKINAFEMWCCRRLKSPLDSQEFKSVNPKGNQYWIFIGRTDAKAPTLWPSDAKSQLTVKDPAHWKRPRCWERLKTGGEGEDRGWELDDITDSVDMSLSKFQEVVKDSEACHAAVHGVFQARIQGWVAISFSRGSSRPSDWTWVSCTAGRFSGQAENTQNGSSLRGMNFL